MYMLCGINNCCSTKVSITYSCSCSRYWPSSSSSSSLPECSHLKKKNLFDSTPSLSHSFFFFLVTSSDNGGFTPLWPPGRPTLRRVPWRVLLREGRVCPFLRLLQAPGPRRRQLHHPWVWVWVSVFGRSDLSPQRAERHLCVDVRSLPQYNGRRPFSLRKPSSRAYTSIPSMWYQDWNSLHTGPLYQNNQSPDQGDKK